MSHWEKIEPQKPGENLSFVKGGYVLVFNKDGSGLLLDPIKVGQGDKTPLFVIDGIDHTHGIPKEVDSIIEQLEQGKDLSQMNY